MATFGNACIDRTDSKGGVAVTVFDTVTPAPSAGTLTDICVYMYAASIVVLKVFRLNGSNYDLVWQSSSQSFAIGSNTLSGLSVPILSGDYIGLYIENGRIEADISGTVKQHSGNVTSNTPTSEWSGDTAIMSILATYTVTSPDVYVNSSTGSDSNAGDSCVAGHPVQTFGKAYSLLASGGTIHVCNDGADFSGETVTLNKSFSIDLNGATGSFYMPKAS